MSSVTIVILILVGVVILFLIGYVNHALEKSKLDKARRKAELIDRCRRCANLSDTLPGQIMTVDLKQLLNRIELHVVEQLKTIDRNEPKYKLRTEELRQLIAKADELPIKNLPIKIISDEQTKDVRFQLESLQTQIVRAVEEKIITGAQGKHWVAQIKLMLVNVYIEYFNNLGRQFFEKNQPSQARLVFERGVQFLKKQKDVSLYQQQLKHFEAMLERANGLVLEHTRPRPEQTSELTEGLAQQNQDDEWKKKQIYD